MESTSILDDIKKVLGVAPDYTAFDQDIIMHINSTFSTLSQVVNGVPSEFVIRDNTTEWAAYLGERHNLESVKSYIYMRVRMIFDPPTISSVLASYERQIEQAEWRLSIENEPIPVLVVIVP